MLKWFSKKYLFAPYLHLGDTDCFLSFVFLLPSLVSLYLLQMFSVSDLCWHIWNYFPSLRILNLCTWNQSSRNTTLRLVHCSQSLIDTAWFSLFISKWFIFEYNGLVINYADWQLFIVPIMSHFHVLIISVCLQVINQRNSVGFFLLFNSVKCTIV